MNPLRHTVHEKRGSHKVLSLEVLSNSTRATLLVLELLWVSESPGRCVKPQLAGSTLEFLTVSLSGVRIYLFNRSLVIIPGGSQNPLEELV